MDVKGLTLPQGVVLTLLKNALGEPTRISDPGVIGAYGIPVFWGENRIDISSDGWCEVYYHLENGQRVQWPFSSTDDAARWAKDKWPGGEQKLEMIWDPRPR